MSRIEEEVFRRYSGGRIMLVSAGIALAGVLPLLLYVAFGPEDGNPIGLGLLAVVAVPTGVVGMFVGLVAAIVQQLRRSRT